LFLVNIYKIVVACVREWEHNSPIAANNPPEQNMSKQIQIDGITYNVLSANQFQAGRTELKLQRPNGRRCYYVVMFANGFVTSVV
jgi:hypothetical protein